MIVPIPDEHGYFAGHDGVIYSSHSGEMRPLKPYGKKPTRMAISMRDKCHYVHIVVCSAFHGPRPDGCVVRHLDGNSLNNTAENLAWGTPAENTSDDVRHGKRLGKPARRMSDEEREYIGASDLANNHLSRELGLSADSIRRAKRDHVLGLRRRVAELEAELAAMRG